MLSFSHFSLLRSTQFNQITIQGWAQHGGGGGGEPKDSKPSLIRFFKNQKYLRPLEDLDLSKITPLLVHGNFNRIKTSKSHSTVNNQTDSV